MTLAAALIRARAIWGYTVTVSPALGKIPNQWIVEVLHDPAIHRLDENGRVICQHLLCEEVEALVDADVDLPQRREGRG